MKITKEQLLEKDAKEDNDAYQKFVAEYGEDGLEIEWTLEKQLEMLRDTTYRQVLGWLWWKGILEPISMASIDLSGADLSWTDLRGADLSRANLRGAELTWTNLSRANLSRANLNGAKPRWGNLSGADLSWTDLRGADLNRANLRGADMRGADLSGADLTGTNLSDANLRGVNLRGADLTWADLRGADMRGAISNRATIWPKGFALEARDYPQVGDVIRVDWPGCDEKKEFFVTSIQRDKDGVTCAVFGEGGCVGAEALEDFSFDPEAEAWTI